MSEKEKLRRLIEESDNIVFFGGAGVSTESGIKDFRSSDGIYNMKFDYPPETMLSHSFFVSQPRGSLISIPRTQRHTEPTTISPSSGILR